MGQKQQQQKQQQLLQQLQQQPQQLQGHFGNFFENDQAHVVNAHVAFSKQVQIALRPVLDTLAQLEDKMKLLQQRLAEKTTE